MKSILNPAVALLVTVTSSSVPAAASQPAAPGSMMAQHEEIVQGLSRYATQGTATAAAAEKVLDLMRPHLQKEEELVFPLLSLLPDVSEGRITANMTFAIAAADRLKEEREALFDQHAEIQSAVGDLILAGQDASEQDLVDFASRVAAHAMSEVEILEPAAVLVGDAVRQQLTPSK